MVAAETTINQSGNTASSGLIRNMRNNLFKLLYFITLFGSIILLSSAVRLSYAAMPSTPSSNQQTDLPRQIIARLKSTSSLSQGLSENGISSSGKSTAFSIPGLKVVRSLRFEKKQAGIRSAVPAVAQGVDIAVLSVTDDDLSLADPRDRYSYPAGKN